MTKPKKTATPSGKTTSGPSAGGRKAASEASKARAARGAGASAPAASSSKFGGAAKGSATRSAGRSGGDPSTSHRVGDSKPAAGAPAAPAAAPAGRQGNGKSASGSKSTPAAPPPDAPLPPRKLPKGGPSKSDLRRYRDRLLALRRDLLASSRDLEAEVMKSSGSDFSVDHMADNGSDNYEHDFSLSLLEGEGLQLAEIRDALLKIDGKLDPPFGVCEACADADLKLCPTCPWIPSARLDAMPHARMCVQTKEQEEKRRG